MLLFGINYERAILTSWCTNKVVALLNPIIDEDAWGSTNPLTWHHHKLALSLRDQATSETAVAASHATYPTPPLMNIPKFGGTAYIGMFTCPFFVRFRY